MIYDKLFDWQKKIVDNSLDKQSYGLFLDMGLGKSPISLAFAEKHNCSKILVISINSKALENEDIKGSFSYWNKFSNIEYNYSYKNKTNFNVSQNDFYIINYESLFSRSKDRKKTLELNNNVVEFIKSCKGHNVTLILDESHKLKDLSSLQTKAVKKIQKELLTISSNLYTYLLSGTPFTIGYIDLYSQLKLLGYDKNKQYFKDMYCEIGNIPGLIGYQQPIVGYKNIDELFNMMHDYCITIESNSVIDLPKQIFIEHVSDKTKSFDMLTKEKVNGLVLSEYILDKEKELNEIGKKRLKEYKVDKQINNIYYRDIAYDINKEYGISPWLAETTGAFWMRARQISIGFNGNAEDSKWFNEQRLNDLKEFLKNNEDNYILFYNYTPELLKIYEICEELGYNIDVYCGEVKSETFYTKYEHQTKEQRLTNKKNILISNFASGSTAKNWQLYNKCIIFSLPVYKDWSQGIKRIHRIGSKETVIYHVFYQKNWLDKGMYDALREGKEYTEKMFESDYERVEEMLK